MSNFFSKYIITLNMRHIVTGLVFQVSPSFSPLLLAHVWRSTPDPMARLGQGDIKCCRCQWAEPLWCAGARMTVLQTAFYFWRCVCLMPVFCLYLNYFSAWTATSCFFSLPTFNRVAPLIPWPYGDVTDKHLEINVSVRYRNLFFFVYAVFNYSIGRFFLYLLQAGNSQYSFCWLFCFFFFLLNITVTGFMTSCCCCSWSTMILSKLITVKY